VYSLSLSKGWASVISPLGTEWVIVQFSFERSKGKCTVNLWSTVGVTEWFTFDYELKGQVYG